MNKCLVLLLAAVSFGCLGSRFEENLERFKSRQRYIKRREAEYEATDRFEKKATCIYKQLYDSLKQKQLSSKEERKFESQLIEARKKALSICSDRSLYVSDKEERNCSRDMQNRLTEIENSSASQISKYKVLEVNTNTQRPLYKR